MLARFRWPKGGESKAPSRGERGLVHTGRAQQGGRAQQRGQAHFSRSSELLRSNCDRKLNRGSGEK